MGITQIMDLRAAHDNRQHADGIRRLFVVCSCWERRAYLCLELIAVKHTISDDRQGGTVMWHINAQLDWEMGERAGAGATFQVIELKDDEENDLTDLVDQGRHFHSI